MLIAIVGKQTTRLEYTYCLHNITQCRQHGDLFYLICVD